MRTDISSVGTGGRVQSTAIEAVPRLELPSSRGCRRQRPGLQTQERVTVPEEHGVPHAPGPTHMQIPETVLLGSCDAWGFSVL